MKKFLIAAAALVPVAQPQIAHAGCHGGPGGGSSGGSGGGSHGAQACADTNDVIGFRHCTKFGAWATNLRRPHIIVEGGAIVRQFGSLLDHQTGSVTHGTESFAYRVIAQPRSRPLDTAVLSTLRASASLSHGLYAAVEVDLGGLTQAGRAATEMLSTGSFGSPELRQDRGFLVDSLGTIGIHGAMHAGGLGVELAGGMRAVSYSFQSNYLTCQQATSITALAPVAEARVRGELWLSPWITAGVTIGTSVIEKGTWMGGLYLGVHTRAFGGER